MRLVRGLLVFIFGAIAAAGAAYFLVVRPQVKTWGADPLEAELPLPGDGLIPDPSATETRGITIDAPPSAVWPWLVQMGFERAGWYSYDQLDNKGTSSSVILPEHQHIEQGEIMPTHPGGGFRVEIVQPEEALVLYIDTELARSQAATAEEAGKADLPTAGLKATGAFSRTAMPDFAASWAFYLRPTDDGRTRLIERFRARTPGQGPATAVFGEIMGTGIVLMTRKQMLGIKQRVEGGASVAVESETEPVMSSSPEIEAASLT